MVAVQTDAPEAIQRTLRIAARALGKAGLAHAYGHCSVRLDSGHFLVCAPEPMLTIEPGEPGTVVATEGELPEGVLGEVRIHQQIYLRRPGIGAVCRIMPPRIMSLSTQGVSPLLRHGLSAYFSGGVPLWEDPRLLRDDTSARDLVQFMADSRAVIMRGNGAVVVGETIEQAVTYSWFLEDTARIEMDIRTMGFPVEGGQLSASELADRQVTTGRVYERMWRFLTAGDPEARTGNTPLGNMT